MNMFRILALLAVSGAILSAQAVGEEPQPIEASVTASSWETVKHGGFRDFPPELTLDGDFHPHSSWRAEGEGVWIQYEISGEQLPEKIGLQFFKGSERRYSFEIQTSKTGKEGDWSATSGKLESSGSATDWEFFELPGESSNFIRIVGYGNSSEKFPEWTNIVEVAFE